MPEAPLKTIGKYQYQGHPLAIQESKITQQDTRWGPQVIENSTYQDLW